MTVIADRKSASHGEAGYPRRAYEFYPTEPWVTEALCRDVEFETDQLVWEPACGDGRMAKVLHKWSAAVVASDIVDHGYGDRGHDFLDPATLTWLRSVRNTPIGAIVTNPPFGSLAVRFIQRALQLTRETRGKVAMLQRHDFDAAATRRPLFEAPFAAKLILHKRPLWIDDVPDDATVKAGGKPASPRFPFAWYLWDWRHSGPPVIRFLPDPDATPKAVGRLL